MAATRVLGHDWLQSSGGGRVGQMQPHGRYVERRCRDRLSGLPLRALCVRVCECVCARVSVQLILTLPLTMMTQLLGVWPQSDQETQSVAQMSYHQAKAWVQQNPETWLVIVCCALQALTLLSQKTNPHQRHGVCFRHQVAIGSLSLSDPEPLGVGAAHAGPPPCAAPGRIFSSRAVRRTVVSPVPRCRQARLPHLQVKSL